MARLEPGGIAGGKTLAALQVLQPRVQGLLDLDLEPKALNLASRKAIPIKTNTPLNAIGIPIIKSSCSLVTKREVALRWNYSPTMRGSHSPHGEATATRSYFLWAWM